MNERYDFIDFARGFSILAIVLLHALMPLVHGPFQSLIMFGGAGVHVFIFLSGFGLYLSRYTGWTDFYKKRLIKVILPYYLIVTVRFVFNFFVPLYPNDGWFEYLSHIFFFKLFSQRLMISFGYALWFISTIILFYAFYPFLRRFKEKAGDRLFLISCCAISAAWWLLVGLIGKLDSRPWNSAPFWYFWEFALGMAAAGRMRKTGFRFWEWPLKKTAAVFIVSFACAAAIAFKGNAFVKVLNDPFNFFAFAGLMVLVYRAAARFAVPLKQWMVSVGLFSYALYLVHGFVLKLTRYLVAACGLNYNFLFMLAALGICLIAGRWYGDFVKSTIIREVKNGA